ncbi:MAG: hypothetical protein PHD23_09825 [Eubacteriales bacterium]|nr:hypothetical protein [Eubacteriales bacterium]
MTVSPVEVKIVPMKNSTLLKMKDYVKPGNIEEIALSIDDLDLEMVGFKRLDN